LELSSKVAIVSGGSSGIGRAIAQLYAREGAKVVVADISEGKGTVTDIQNERGTALFVKTDVRTEAQVRALVDETVRSFGGLDIVCNSVGVELIRPLAETTEEEWNRILDTNLKGPFLVCKHALPHMMRKKNGVIVNIASQLGIVGLGGMTAYCASKGGLILLTKSMALEHAKYGIRVNCICPGAIDTPMLDREIHVTNDPDAARRAFVSKHPIGRLGTPQEIAQAALFLASDRSSFITGESLVVDGGYVIQ
jgi:NAD(P)-dependent dehydrogenase (short-subunit alcohol dehydrogenase family)